MLDFSVTIAITIINIIVLYFILRLILFKPVTKFIAKRAERIQNSIDKAQQDREEAQKLLLQYQETLNNAEAKADEIIQAAKKTARVEAEKIVDGGRVMAETIISTTHKHMDAERQAMITRFNLEAAALVMAASARLVQRDFSGEDNRRYAAMLLDELSAQKGNV